MQWARIYEPSSPSHKLITDMMNTYFLVNLVHNDFHNRDGIFVPFFKIGAQAHAAAKSESAEAATVKLQANGDAFEKLSHDVQGITISSTA